MKLLKFVFKGTKKEAFGDLHIDEYGRICEVIEDEDIEGNMGFDVEERDDVEMKFRLFKCFLYNVDKFLMGRSK